MIPPLVALDNSTWSLDVLQLVLPPTPWDMVVSGELRLARLTLPLVPASLGGPSNGARQWSGVATRGGADA
jgi:hypothetical protein